MKKQLAALIVSAAFVPPDAVAMRSQAFDELAALVERTKLATAHPSGTAIAVIQDGRVIYEGYFGFADIERRMPVTRDTVFYIASTTKPFLALSTLLQEADGALDTRTSLQAMFPDVRFEEFDARQVTAKHLLIHASGIDNEPLVWATAFSGTHDETTRRQLVAASYPNAKATLGTFEYTNVGYNILSVWLDQKLKKPWQDQLDETIFQPLGMDRTSAYISRAEAQQWPLAKPYSFASADPNAALYLRKSDDTMQAAGGLVSTAPDLAKFIISQLSQGRHAGRQVFPVDVIASSHDPQVAVDGQYLDFKRSGYAWGWYTGEYKGAPLLHHFGGFAGFHAHLSFMPGKNIGLVVLNNEDALSARMTGLIADYVYGVLLGESDTPARMRAEFDTLSAKAMQMQAGVAKQRAAILAREWKLSGPLEAYAGTYANALLGDMVVELTSDRKLVVRWGRLAATAAGYDRQDTVRVEFAPNSGEVLSFVPDEQGIAAVSFANATFTRVR